MIIQEYKYLREGPGAGYEVNGDFTLNTISDIKIHNKSVNNGIVTVECSFNSDVTFNELYFKSYMYGNTLTGINSKISAYAFVDFDNIGYNYYDSDEEFLNSIDERDIEQLTYSKIIFGDVYGGGWSHATYDGTLENGESIYPKGSASYISLSGKIIDHDLVDYIDKSVTGETIITSYAVWADNDIEDTFDEEDEAIAYAKANRGDWVERSQWEEIYLGNGHYDEEPYSDSEIVWERDYDKVYRYDD